MGNTTRRILVLMLGLAGAAAAEEAPCDLQIQFDGGQKMVAVPVQEVIPLGRPAHWGPPSGASITWVGGDGQPEGPPVPLGPTVVFDATGLTPEERSYVTGEFLRRQKGGGRTRMTRLDRTTGRVTELWAIQPLEIREYHRWQAEGCPPGRFEVDRASIDRLAGRGQAGGGGGGPAAITPKDAAFKHKLRFGTLDAQGNLTPAAPPPRAQKTRRSAITAGP